MTKIYPTRGTNYKRKRERPQKAPRPSQAQPGSPREPSRPPQRPPSTPPGEGNKVTIFLSPYFPLGNGSGTPHKGPHEVPKRPPDGPKTLPGPPESPLTIFSFGQARIPSRDVTLPITTCIMQPCNLYFCSWKLIALCLHYKSYQYSLF